MTVTYFSVLRLSFAKMAVITGKSQRLLSVDLSVYI